MSKPRKKYSIVEFPDGLQIIPSCWINTQNNESIWPSYVKSRQTLDKLLIKAVIPIEIDKWDTCKIRRMFGSADTWERAQEKLVEAIDTSTVYDSDDFSEKEWRSRKKKQRRDNAKKMQYSSHSSENESPKEHYHKISKRRTFSQDLSQLPSLPKPPVISLSSQSSEATTSKTVYQAQSSETLPYTPNKSTSPCTLHHFTNSNSSKEGMQYCNDDDLFPNDFRNFMVKSMVTLLRRTKSLDDRISKIEVKGMQAEIEEYNEEEFAFPFQTEEQLFQFEKKLENPMFFKKMLPIITIGKQFVKWNIITNYCHINCVSL